MQRTKKQIFSHISLNQVYVPAYTYLLTCLVICCTSAEIRPETWCSTRDSQLAVKSCMNKRQEDLRPLIRTCRERHRIVPYRVLSFESDSRTGPPPSSKCCARSPAALMAASMERGSIRASSIRRSASSTSG